MTTFPLNSSNAVAHSSEFVETRMSVYDTLQSSDQRTFTLYALTLINQQLEKDAVDLAWITMHSNNLEGCIKDLDFLIDEFVKRKEEAEAMSRQIEQSTQRIEQSTQRLESNNERLNQICDLLKQLERKFTKLSNEITECKMNNEPTLFSLATWLFRKIPSISTAWHRMLRNGHTLLTSPHYSLSLINPKAPSSSDDADGEKRPDKYTYSIVAVTAIFFLHHAYSSLVGRA